ncbi:MAG: hypothetical protein Rubg2KO_39740 [Rubricoccaceae bacterium]
MLLKRQLEAHPFELANPPLRKQLALLRSCAPALLRSYDVQRSVIVV